MKIGWKPRHNDVKAAGTRIRCLAPMGELRRRGYDAEVFDSRNIDRYSVVVFSKVYDDRTYQEIVSLKARGAKIVFDLYDNHFYNPNSLPALAKAKDEILRMMMASDAVVASTEAMANEMREQQRTATSPLVVIGDSVEETSIDVAGRRPYRWFSDLRIQSMLREIRADKETGATPIIWFGIHGGPNADYGMKDLVNLRSLMEDISKDYPLSLTIVSNSKSKYRELIAPWEIKTRYVEWDAATFDRVLRMHEIAVIPVTLNPFTRCKSPNRLMQALYSGLAVVADPVPSYEEFSGVAAIGDWEGGLRSYLRDPNKRKGDVERGRKLITDQWTVERITDRWEELINRLHRGGNA